MEKKLKKMNLTSLLPSEEQDFNTDNNINNTKNEEEDDNENNQMIIENNNISNEDNIKEEKEEREKMRQRQEELKEQMKQEENIVENEEEKDKKEEETKSKKDEDDNKEEEIQIFKFPKPSEKLLNYQPFNRNSIKIEENPLKNFEIYPKNLFEFNLHNIPKKVSNIQINESINNINNTLSIKSCYLLAKIKNWRLVTNFVPASTLTEEKFQNIIPLNEDEDKDESKKEVEKEPEKEGVKKEEKPKKSYLVYSEKYEEIVDKSLEEIMQKKKKVKKDIFNKRYIITQYNYDILKLKNKLKQNKYIINYLNIKQENSQKALDLDNKE